MQERAESSNRSYALTGERRRKTTGDRRSKTRNYEAELRCTLGQVMDISSTGMRVTCRRVPKEKRVEFLLNTTVAPLPVLAEVVWTKRLGFRKHEVGLHFIDPSLKLVNLIRCCSLSGTVWRWRPPG